MAATRSLRIILACGIAAWALPALPVAQEPTAGSAELVDRLSNERSEKAVELDQIENSIALSKEKIASLTAEIDALSGDTASLKEALVASAERRRGLEEQIA
ncbi:MAG: hypothetical protein ABGW90_13985, partial [Martelella sp.]